MLGLNIEYVALPFEQIRILYSLIYLGIFSYYDLKYDRDIPDKMVYGLTAISLVFLIFYPIQIQIYAILQAIVTFSFVYMLYRMGQMGLAEAFSLSSLTIIFPIAPVLSNVALEIPFLFFIFTFSGLIFALFTIIFIIKKIGLKKKIGTKELALILIYIIFIYVFLKSPFANNWLFLTILTILFFSSLLSSMYNEDIKKAFATKIPVEKAEEEVFAYELASKKEKELVGKNKIINKEIIKRLKKGGLKKITIYKMFPFSPFLLLGLIFSLFFSNIILLF